MGILYVGNCEFEEIDSSDITKDPWSMDAMTRTYAGRRDKLTAFLATLTKNKPDDEYRQLFATQWRVRNERAFSYVTLELAGLLDGKLPDPTYHDGTSRESIQLENLNGEQTEVEYYAPTTTIRYVSRTRPTKRLYGGRLQRTKDAFQILGRRGNKTRELTLDLATLNAQNFAYHTDIVSTQDSDQVGIYWRVTEVNTGRLLDGKSRNVLGAGAIVVSSIPVLNE